MKEECEYQAAFHTENILSPISSMEFFLTWIFYQWVRFTRNCFHLHQNNISCILVLKLVDEIKSPVTVDYLVKRNCLLYYPDSPDPRVGPYAVRCGQYKLHVYTRGNSLSDDDNIDPMCRSSARLARHHPPLLYNLNNDPGSYIFLI